MKDLYILSLHLAYGGLQKAVAEFANLMADHYMVHILSFYNMPLGPAYPIDSRVQIHYLYDDIPNREEFHAALAGRNLPGVLREGLRATKTLLAKRQLIIQAIKNISSGIIVSTRDEYAVLLSRFGKKNIVKIAQFHEDHAYKKDLVRHFSHDYGNIDLFVLLSPKMAEEVREIMKDNRHTRVVYIPNFDFNAVDELITEAVGNVPIVEYNNASGQVNFNTKVPTHVVGDSLLNELVPSNSVQPSGRLSSFLDDFITDCWRS